MDRWPEWNPAVGVAAIDGPIREGAPGRYAPSHRLLGPLHRRTAPSFRVSAFEPGHRLALQQPQPGGSQLIEWTIEERDGGTLFTQHVKLDGSLSQQFGLSAGEPLVRGFAAQCARLYRLASPQGAVGFVGAGGAVGTDGTNGPGGTDGMGGTDDDGVADALTVVAGGTGFLGTLLAANLVCDGRRVALLTRNPRPSPFEQILWDGRRPGEWSSRLSHESELMVVNLAGVSLDMPGTPENLARLESSRTEPTRALVEGSRSWKRPAARWLQQSAVGIYGDSAEEFDEHTPTPASAPGLAAVVRGWEAAVDGANADHLTVFRTGVVLAREAALLDRLTAIARLGGGGPLGSGKQWFSWIHAADWVRAARASLGLPTAPGESHIELPAGVVNATSPHPVQKRELMAHVREYVGMPVGIPAPAGLLRIAATVMRTNPDLALDSVQAVPAVLREAGFTFRYPQLAGAFREMAV